MKRETRTEEKIENQKSGKERKECKDNEEEVKEEEKG